MTRTPGSKVPAVKTVKVGGRTMIVRASLFDAIGIVDPVPQPDRPVLVTHRKAQELANLSKSTVDRMIFAGRAETSVPLAATTIGPARMTREALVEIMARRFCDEMYIASHDARRSRWDGLQGWRQDNYRVAAGKVLDELIALGMPQ